VVATAHADMCHTALPLVKQSLLACK